MTMLVETAPVETPHDRGRVRKRLVPALVIFAGSVFVERWGIGLPGFTRNWAENVVDVFGLAGAVSWAVLPLYHRKKSGKR